MGFFSGMLEKLCQKGLDLLASKVRAYRDGPLSSSLFLTHSYHLHPVKLLAEAHALCCRAVNECNILGIVASGLRTGACHMQTRRLEESMPKMPAFWGFIGRGAVRDPHQKRRGNRRKREVNRRKSTVVQGAWPVLGCYFGRFPAKRIEASGLQGRLFADFDAWGKRKQAFGPQRAMTEAHALLECLGLGATL